MKKLFALSALVFTVSCSFAADTIRATTPPQKILTAEGARFVFGQVSDFRADQFLLDTKTGRMWKIVYDGDNAILQPVLYYTPGNPSTPRTAEPPPSK